MSDRAWVVLLVVVFVGLTALLIYAGPPPSAERDQADALQRIADTLEAREAREAHEDLCECP